MQGSNTKSLDNEQRHLIEKLNSSARPVAFLFGAGTSIPGKLPDMQALTKKIEAGLKGSVHEKVFGALLAELKAGEHIEHILGFLETVSRLGSISKVLYGKGNPPHDWAGLIGAIKKLIVLTMTSEVDLNCPATQSFAQWLNSKTGRTEIYTTNYDLLIESALENASVLFFDGFIGAVSPQFQPAAIDPVMFNASKEVRPPDSWIRLWKLHGSINWTATMVQDKLAVRRMPKGVDTCLIYPSSEKYSDSRRLPYIVLQDKFRRDLLTKDMSLVILGYGFGDEHLNEIIFNALERNKKLDVNVLNYEELPADHALRKLQNKHLLNLTVFSPKVYLHQGLDYEWEDKKECKLGDAGVFFPLLEKSGLPLAG